MEFQCPYCERFQGTPYWLREHINNKHPYNKYPAYLRDLGGFMELDEKKNVENIPASDTMPT